MAYPGGKFGGTAIVHEHRSQNQLSEGNTAAHLKGRRLRPIFSVSSHQEGVARLCCGRERDPIERLQARGRDRVLGT
jgi:hypothetical protein